MHRTYGLSLRDSNIPPPQRNPPAPLPPRYDANNLPPVVYREARALGDAPGALPRATSPGLNGALRHVAVHTPLHFAGPESHRRSRADAAADVAADAAASSSYRSPRAARSRSASTARRARRGCKVACRTPCSTRRCVRGGFRPRASVRLQNRRRVGVMSAGVAASLADPPSVCVVRARRNKKRASPVSCASKLDTELDAHDFVFFLQPAQAT